MNTESVLPSHLATLMGGVAVGWALKTLVASSSCSATPATPNGACCGCACCSPSGASGDCKIDTSAAPSPPPKAPAQQPKSASFGEAPTGELKDRELKMVLCVNASLSMGKGKIGAQCAHAAVGIIESYREANEAVFAQWDATGHPKVALKVKDGDEMAKLAERARDAGLFWYLVEDQGRTQIAAGSHTVLAVGPAPRSEIDKVTGHLSLM